MRCMVECRHRRSQGVPWMQMHPQIRDPLHIIEHSTKLALQNKHFSVQNDLKLTYRHLKFQKFSWG